MLDLDKTNGNDLWWEAIKKEMKAVRIAFKILEGDEKPPPASQFMKCHMIFDIKMEDFRRKARLVAGGHTTETLKTFTYASVVSQEMVQIALMVAALNDLEVKTSDVQNAYLMAPCAEVIHTMLGAEFGEDEGKTAIIGRALYGLASAGASFRNHLADCMRHLGYTSCLADPDLWYKLMVWPEDNFSYYSYVLLYVDDCLCICHDAEAEIHKIDKFFTMKKGSIGDPGMYLGARVKRMEMPNGVQAWALSSSKYVQEAVQNVKSYLRDELGGQGLKKRAPTPFMSEYDPEMDITKEVSAELATYFQSQIGILCWMVEMGQIDVAMEVSLLASHVALPWEGHLEAVFHMYLYLRHKHNSCLALDPTYPQIHMGDFH